MNMKKFKEFAKMVSLNGIIANPLKDLVRAGNTKIPTTTAIFNMSSATDCPSRKKGLCKACIGEKNYCYAIKSERDYRPNVLPFRIRQTEYWLNVTAEQFVTQFLLTNVMKPVPFDSLRLNEAGDFHSQACVDKAEKIARILKKYGIVTYCYTSRDDLDYSKVKALKVSGSGFKKKGIVNIFKMIESKADRPKGYGICPMDCKVCNRCLKSGMNTAVLKH